MLLRFALLVACLTGVLMLGGMAIGYRPPVFVGAVWIGYAVVLTGDRYISEWRKED